MQNQLTCLSTCSVSFLLAYCNAHRSGKFQEEKQRRACCKEGKINTRSCLFRNVGTQEFPLRLFSGEVLTEFDQLPLPVMFSEAWVHPQTFLTPRSSFRHPGFTFYSSNEQTPWRWALHEKPPVVQLLKNFPTSYGTRRFIPMFTRVFYWFLS
jgi:hypothetical protein